jgi:UDP-glucose 4-epimerase
MQTPPHSVQARASGIAQTVVITGGAGFIGSNVADHLLELGHTVRVIDNLSTGHERFLEKAKASERFQLIPLDLVEESSSLPKVIEGADVVIHLAANADVRFGWDHPGRDLRENTVATHNVLEAMRTTGVKRIMFSSTGSVYGEAKMIPTPEDAPFPLQTSLYGASKLAAEGLVNAYAVGCDFKATIFRFVSIMGPRYTHGHVFDFVKQLLADPTRLAVLGNGTQCKSYLHVSDCCRAITSMLDAGHRCEVYNLGVDGYCTLNDSIGWICNRLGVDPELVYSGGDRGWIGDNPFIYLDTAKISATGWKTEYTIQAAVEDTVDKILESKWVLDRVEARV